MRVDSVTERLSLQSWSWEKLDVLKLYIKVADTEDFLVVPDKSPLCHAER